MSYFQELGDEYTSSSVGAMQASMNRVALRRGWTLLPITGGVGPLTISMFKKLQSEPGLESLKATAATKSDMESNAGTIAGFITGFANTWNMPEPPRGAFDHATIPKPPKSTGSGAKPNTPGGGAPGATWPPPPGTPVDYAKYAPYAAGAVVLAFFLFKKKGR